MFVLVGFILLTLTVFFVSGVYFFRPGYQLNVMFDYVSILDKGAPVRMAGVRIGEVTGVELLYDAKTSTTRVKVKLFIEKKVEIRDNYVFKIAGTHILSEPHIEISPQAGGTGRVESNATIEGASPVAVETLIQTATEIASKLEAILKNLHTALGDEKTGQEMKTIITNLASLTQSMDKVVNGSEGNLQDTVKNIDASAQSLNAILDKVQRGEGTAGKLLMSDELYQELRAFVSEIKTHPWRLMKSDRKRFLFF